MGRGVVGINPHAGEGGLFGDEDERITKPAVQAMRARGWPVDGPLGADLAFSERKHDAYVAMLHDQGHVAVKMLSPKGASAIAAGLPFLFSSVGHGAAFDLAGQGRADADAVEVELPFGDFYLRDGHAPVVMVAGGTGFAPMQSLLEDALAKQRERSFTLYWGARREDGLYAMDQVRKWEQKFPHFRFVGVISEGDAPHPLRRGLVHEAVLQDLPSLAGHQVYVCGAPALVSAARDAFVHQRQLKAADFFSDAFATTVAEVASAG